MSGHERSIPEPVGIAPPDGVLLLLSNVADDDAAHRIARTLVEERLAACVNLLPGCTSIYRWQGAIEEAQETTLLIKTSRRRHAACQQRLKELHPYEVPEMVTVAPDAVWPAYASWVLAETRPARQRQAKARPEG
ncbi:MAG: divalent-cation tolerance protein CutA [Burkholderiaceae bacterium]